MTWTAEKLRDVDLAERESLLPEHLRKVVGKARALGLQSLWIYGSRARGDARPQSDFDLAFQFNEKSKWSSFVVDLTENPPSLYRYDLVDLDAIDRDFREKILEEGVQIL